MFQMKEKMASEMQRKFQNELAVSAKQYEEEKAARQKLIKE
jgi:hypothetical protein